MGKSWQLSAFLSFDVSFFPFPMYPNKVPLTSDD